MDIKAELIEGGFEVVNDFLGENVTVGKVVRFFEAFIFEPEDVGIGFVSVASFSFQKCNK